MGFSLQPSSSGTGGAAAGISSITLPNSYSTAANDCIVIAMSLAGSPTAGASGCGATWVVITEATAPECVLLIGYGCTAGGTTVTLTGLSGITAYGYVVGVFAGVQTSPSPVVGNVVATSGGSSVTTLTTPSLSYSANQLLVGAGGQGGVGGQFASTWGNAVANTNVGYANVAGTRACTLDYQNAPAGASTTYTMNCASNQARSIAANLTAAAAAANNDSMFAVMGP